jgi:hypothetical protein
MDVAKAILLLGLGRPVLSACAIVLTFGVGVYAVRRPRTVALSLLATACFVTVMANFIYLGESLHTQWGINLFPVAVWRVLLLVVELLFIIEVFLWPLALLFLIRERRASIPPARSETMRPPFSGEP